MMLKYLGLTLMCATASCAAVKSADAPVTMRVSPVFAGAGQTLPGAIAVAPVQARGVTSGQRYAYIDAAAPGEIRQAKRFFWEEPTPHILERALVAGLKTRFASVTGPEVGVAGDRRVVAVLSRFEELSGGSARAMVAFDTSIVAAGKLSRSGHYCGSAPVDGATGSVRAHAFEAAVEAAVTAFVQDISGAGSAPSSC